MRRGFTLMEVNLAILVMAGGILAMVSLYSFGYRENRQSREDVGGAALADAVLSPMIMAASATNLKWSVFKNEFHYPSSSGWLDYVDQSKGTVSTDPKGKAGGVFSDFMSKMSGAADGQFDVDTSTALSGTGLTYGLVVSHDQDSPVVYIAFRATQQAGQLLSMPVYVTAVRFQGDPDQ